MSVTEQATQYSLWTELPIGHKGQSADTINLYNQMDDAYSTLEEAEPNQSELIHTFNLVANDIPFEFARQYRKFGNQYHDIPAWEMITGEEWGEAIKAMNASIYNPTTENYNEAIKETVEMIACAIQLIHELRRRRDNVNDGEYTVQT